jgi:hypothetical protein
VLQIALLSQFFALFYQQSYRLIFLIDNFLLLIDSCDYLLCFPLLEMVDLLGETVDLALKGLDDAVKLQLSIIMH